jgi:hypothetical protein
MTSFDGRRREFETRFASDAEARFRVEARRDKIVGAWAAKHLGKTGGAAEDYAREVVRADLEEAGDDDVFRKLRADLPASVSDQEIRTQMAKALDEAMAQERK